MKEIGMVKIHCISEALSPITHMMGVKGNESILSREKIYFANKIVEIPFLSGNALRHKMIREPGALHIIEIAELKGKLTVKQGNFFLSGGALTESSISDNLSIISKMQKILPLYRLLGGCLPGQIIGGSLFVSRGYLCCKENKETIEKLAGDIKIENNYDMAENFINNYQYTRGDIMKKNARELVDEAALKERTNLMVYNGQNIIKGSYFYHDLILNNISVMELGAALFSIHKWQNNGGIIGGSSRIGHGKLKTSVYIENLTDWFGNELKPDELIEKYINHVIENKKNICDWLSEAFPNKLAI